MKYSIPDLRTLLTVLGLLGDRIHNAMRGRSEEDWLEDRRMKLMRAIEELEPIVKRIERV